MNQKNGRKFLDDQLSSTGAWKDGFVSANGSGLQMLFSIIGGHAHFDLGFSVICTQDQREKAAKLCLAMIDFHMSKSAAESAKIRFKKESEPCSFEKDYRSRLNPTQLRKHIKQFNKIIPIYTKAGSNVKSRMEYLASEALDYLSIILERNKYPAGWSHEFLEITNIIMGRLVESVDNSRKVNYSIASDELRQRAARFMKRCVSLSLKADRKSFNKATMRFHKVKTKALVAAGLITPLDTIERKPKNGTL